jgi:hypothetical protein
LLALVVAQKHSREHELVADRYLVPFSALGFIGGRFTVGEHWEYRHQMALEAFMKHPLLQFCDLPNGVGMKTMDELIALGLIEVADPRVGRFSFGYASRLKG